MRKSIRKIKKKNSNRKYPENLRQRKKTKLKNNRNRRTRKISAQKPRKYV